MCPFLTTRYHFRYHAPVPFVYFAFPNVLAQVYVKLQYYLWSLDSELKPDNHCEKQFLVERYHETFQTHLFLSRSHYWNLIVEDFGPFFVSYFLPLEVHLVLINLMFLLTFLHCFSHILDICPHYFVLDLNDSHSLKSAHLISPIHPLMQILRLQIWGLAHPHFLLSMPNLQAYKAFKFSKQVTTLYMSNVFGWEIRANKIHMN